ncbi:MAG: hypothetical protein IJ193_02135 [Bacilli bacterium]|nr:hypothetical protein [Bacilli bacterium]
MGLFSKKRKDADYIQPKDTIQAIVPFIMKGKCVSEVSSTVEFDVTNLVNFVDEKNQEDLGYKMTYFHAILACFAKTLYNRPALNNFVKDKRLYARKRKIFAFIAKNKLSDEGEERMVSVDLESKWNVMNFSKKVAVDVFEAKHEGDNNMEGVLKFFTSFPNWLLNIIVSIVLFLDRKGINPKALTEGDTNYATILFSNLGSIKTNSCYHHLNEYGTNSIVITIGTIKDVGNRKIVDLTCTLDERIADGFYFAKSIQLAEYIAKNPELLMDDFDTRVEMKK